ncbi:hypothetical protein HDU98_002294 [Podochytrium sp. JEL0797]|nr:hypothetical protein HDU98_002294 [Podochytrium sp. JEL0797]
MPKIALIVGGSNGIGRALAAALVAAKVDTVIVASRNLEKTTRVAQEIGAHEVHTVNVIDQQDVARFSLDLHAKHSHIDYLILTSSCVFEEKRITENGVDELLAVNFLWRFQLIGLLRDLLAAAPGGSRVINIAGAGINSDVFFTDPNFTTAPEQRTLIKALWQAQQLNDVCFLEAQKRWGRDGNGTAFHVVNPGIVATGADVSGINPVGRFMFQVVLYPFKQSMESSARRLMPVVVGLMGKEGGKLWSASYWTGAVSEIEPAARVVDPEYALKCWQLAESLVKK